MRAKPLSRAGECPLVIVRTKGITADHGNWIEQHNKQDSYSRKVETFLNDTIIVNKYSSVDIWVCPFIVHIKEGGLISPLETVIYSKLKSWEKKNQQMTHSSHECHWKCTEKNAKNTKSWEQALTTKQQTANFIENWKIINYITFPPANSL